MFADVKVDTDWTVSILSAIGVLVAGSLLAVGIGFRKVIDAFFSRWSEQIKNKQYQKGLSQQFEVAVVLDQLRQLAAVDRVLWFVGRNGGGLPKPGQKYTVRAEHGWTSDGRLDVLTMYNFDLIVDHHYIDMLIAMLKEGSVKNTVETMPDGAILKAYYRDEGVKQSLLYTLNIAKDELNYLSIASYKGEFTKEQIARIEMLVMRLRGLVCN